MCWGRTLITNQLFKAVFVNRLLFLMNHVFFRRGMFHTLQINWERGRACWGVHQRDSSFIHVRPTTFQGWGHFMSHWLTAKGGIVPPQGARYTSQIICIIRSHAKPVTLFSIVIWLLLKLRFYISSLRVGQCKQNESGVRMSANASSLLYVVINLYYKGNCSIKRHGCMNFSNLGMIRGTVKETCH